jgi:2-hydroxy-6-oxonona-2,4-dienedioate hydrolase/4,5:9,10-diseco-3-hydroxy-5,9,17-trioxoandrosta-1(10),2-diene-4-oate hydrolase
MKTIAMLTAVLTLSAVAAHAQPAVTAKDVTVYGQKIHYLEAGQGAPVVFIHGTGGEGARWMPQLRELSADFRVIAVDLIGFGSSDKPLTQYHNGVFAEFVAGALKAIGVQKASFVGQSAGANIVLYLAIHYPQLVDKIVLANGGGFRAANAPAPQGGGTPNWHARQIANAATLMESREYLEQLYYDDSIITDAMVVANLELRLKAAFTITSMGLAGERGLGTITEAEVRALKTPTLLLWGANDTMATVAASDRLLGAIAGSRRILIDKAGHYPFLEHPAEFNKHVRDFLTSTT